MDVSVIIVNYNTYQLTLDCINSVFEKTSGVEFEIVLVDNASTDESKRIFEKDQRIRYVYSFENMGFGRANNVGMMLSTGQYYFLLNSDTILLNNAIKIFYDYAESHTKKAFYGCWLQDKNGYYIHSGGDMPSVKQILTKTLKPYNFFFRKGNKYRDEDCNTYEEKECVPIGFITGADLFFHRSVYEMTGGFDHNFFLYFEETDWQKRASYIGVERYIINAARILHLEGGSNKQPLKNREKKKSGRSITATIFESQHLFVKKHNSLLKYIFYRVVLAILEIPVLVMARIAFGQELRRPLKALLK